MTLNIRKLFLASSLFFSLRSFAEVFIDITLTPVGSFAAKSKSVTGFATRKGDLLIAKDVVLDLSTLDSGIELRDEHMKNDYFEINKYPKAVLKSAKGKNGKFVGLLNIRGVTQKVIGTFTASGKSIQAEFKTRLSDYKIKKAIYMGVGVKDEVTVKAELPLK